MTWEDFIQEFNEQYFNISVTREYYNEFNNFRQENLSVTETVKRFNQLARMCPHMVPNKEEWLKRMIGMLRPEIVVIVDSRTTPPTTTAECVRCVLRAEYHLNKQKNSQPRQSEVPKNNNNNNNQNRGNFGNQGRSQGGQWNNNKRKENFFNQRNHNNCQAGGQPTKQAKNIPPCSKCGKLHLGECRMGTNLYYGCGHEGNLSKDCPNKTYQPFQQRQRRNPPAQLHSMQAVLEGLHIFQGRLEAPPLTTNVRIFTMTKEEAAVETSTVVTGYLESGIHYESMTLLSGEVMISTLWLRAVPMKIVDREFYSNLIVLEMFDYDLILEEDEVVLVSNEDSKDASQWL
ncbi:hypothetical protein TIFTF001_047969 [Ficus carica]|uniref:Retrotransposon gag domain-containing protein n=1 Tax=Ficus carica TaxID=3494 RepID=A0AA88CTZ4_FICCA|nr:hypothetical protein TIFTF001_047963 [Ficus carica]GMN29832.1 hypothetical protein TIFTF001_047965 [Ficus carica]GMN29852.1 hypothetical protein TIFTF001_047967 [Ficus carica]GMN29870.1 hypothetical protein TIFTF001_047969 [Ficus carica]